MEEEREGEKDGNVQKSDTETVYVLNALNSITIELGKDELGGSDENKEEEACNRNNSFISPSHCVCVCVCV